MLRVLVVAAAITAVALTASDRRGAVAASRAPVWEVYALRYATVPAFPVRYLVAGADTTRTIDIAMMFWLLEGPAGRRVLVDAGFYRQKFIDSWKPKGFVPIAQTLDAKSNLAAQDRMKKLASARRLIVPGHDPAVFDRFKSAGPGAVKIE